MHWSNWDGRGKTGNLCTGGFIDIDSLDNDYRYRTENAYEFSYEREKYGRENSEVEEKDKN